MNLLSIFSSSSKAIDAAANIAEKSADGIIGGIDKMFYTDQEKAEAKAKYFTFWLDTQKVIAGESAPTAISRRILAFMIMGPFVGMICFSVVVFKYDPAWATFILSQGVERLSLLAGAVGATYFVKDLVVKAIQENKK